MLGSAFWVIFWGYLFSVWVVCVHFILFIKLFLSVYCLNLCRATFAVWITKRTSLASVLLLDKESDALHKINDYIYKGTEHKYFGCLNMSSELLTVCCWAGNEGNRSTFRPRVKRRAAVLSVISPRRTRLQLGVRASAVTVKTELQSGPFTRELHLFNV